MIQAFYTFFACIFLCSVITNIFLDLNKNFCTRGFYIFIPHNLESKNSNLDFNCGSFSVSASFSKSLESFDSYLSASPLSIFSVYIVLIEIYLSKVQQMYSKY